MSEAARRPVPADAALPLDRDALFGTAGADGLQQPAAAAAPAPGSEPGSREELFGLSEAGTQSEDAAPAPAAKHASAIRGFVQVEPAYTYASPGHWSRGVVRTQGEVQGRLRGGAKWKASARIDLDPVYWHSDFYPDPVREDQRAEFLVRETYLDLPLTDTWELRLGRQHVVWGEVVGLFFADVVSARDLRDFILPEFDILRIPQWAARTERFGKDTHFELLWIPFPSYDDIGKPGAEFYPFRPPAVPGFAQVVLDQRRPGYSLDNTNYGARVSRLFGGWDLSAFYYRSISAAPTLYRSVQSAPGPTLVFEPRHERIWQLGGTLSKDLRRVVLKGEIVYTDGRGFETLDPADADGVARQDTIDYIVSLDFMLPYEGRLNVQAFQRVFLDHDPHILFEEIETGVSLLASAKVAGKLEPQFMIIQSLDSNDRMVRPRLAWNPHANVRAALGVDIFAGPADGAFGRFADRDRLYGEFRYSF